MARAFVGWVFEYKPGFHFLIDVIHDCPHDEDHRLGLNEQPGVIDQRRLGFLRDKLHHMRETGASHLPNPELQVRLDAVLGKVFANQCAYPVFC